MIYLRLLTGCLCMLLGLVNGNAQTRTITVRAVDVETQSPVPNVIAIVTGTTSRAHANVLGYFQLELAKGYNKLLVSHIGYETGEIDIPEVDNFTIELQPKSHKLKSLNLVGASSAHGPYYDVGSSGFESHAKFYEGWEGFYNRLGILIKQDSAYQKDNIDAIAEFTIDKKGEIGNVLVTPDSSLNRQLIISSLKQMEKWEPAKQNEFPVDQTFYIKFINSEEEVFALVEEMALPVGGYETFYRYVAEQLRYPQAARKNGVEGKVYVQFVVQKDGTLAEVQVVKGIGFGCDEEVVRVVGNSQKWQPGLIDNNPVPQRIILPITFALGGEIRHDGPEYVFHSKPTFPGDVFALSNYVEKHKRKIDEPIPPNSLGNSVYLDFVVKADGTIANIGVARSLGAAFDAEAIRIYSNMPKWIPGKSQNKPVDRKVTAIVSFNNIPANKRSYAASNFSRGVSFYQEGKLDKALDQFTKAIEKNPTQLDYYFNRAMVLIELDQIDKACKDLEVIKDSDQEALKLYNMNCKQ